MRFSLRTMLMCMTLLCVYLGGYFVLLQPVFYADEYTMGFMAGHTEAEYRIGGVVSKTLFAPLVWLDRKLRPEVWSEGTDHMIEVRIPAGTI